MSTFYAKLSVASSMVKRSNLKRDSMRRLVSMILFCSVELMQLSKGNAELFPEEEIALENWRQSFNLPTWTDDPCSSVDWIVCDNTSQPAHLTTIDLNSDRANLTLTGTIPNTAAFTKISRLVLSNNNITGGIPASLFNHSSLQIIYLDGNPLGGPIPDMSGLTSLKELAMSNTQINGTIPESIKYLTQATVITFYNNPQLKGSIPDLSTLTSLKYFDARNCALSGPLPDLRNAKGLISVQLQWNDFNGSIPPALFQHEDIQLLNLNDNPRLSGQVPDVKGLSSVNNFYLDNCNLSGPFPTFIANSMLNFIGLTNNRFTTFPSDSLLNLTKLVTIRINNNSMEGALPDVSPSSTQTSPGENNLQYLVFGNNRFSGGIPRSWNELKYLLEIDVQHNNLSGVIPKEIGNITTLRNLTFSNNRFSGSIPEELGLLSNLEKLDLENNQFSGTVPESLALLPNLHTLLLKNNRFTGIPEALLQKRPGLNISFDTNITILDRQSTSDSVSVGAIAGVVIGALGATVAVLSVVLCMIKRKWRNKDQIITKDDLPKSAQAFTLKEIKAITGNYKTMIGRGGFGPVYYGKFTDGKEVAVKVRSTDSKQGSKEFLNEVRILSRLHHRNIVPLVGYCLEGQQQILVYGYMSQGSLHDHLSHKGSGSKADDSSVRQPLDWKTRLDIVINAARGIEYLHKDCNPPVIHRDVKTSNILLNDKLEAKVSDLGLSKQVPEPDTDEALNMSGVSTAVKGTFGYLDPEYFVGRKLTTKSDVFSFGVVLLEMITGKRPQSKEFAETTLIDWVGDAWNMNKLESVVDPALKGEYDKEGLMRVARTALTCSLPDSSGRPEMGEIVNTLTEALQIEGGYMGSGTTDHINERSVPFSGQLVAEESYPSFIKAFTSNDDHQSWNTDPR